MPLPLLHPHSNGRSIF